MNAFLPDPAVLDYSAAKGALANFSTSLSKESGPRGRAGQHRQPGTATGRFTHPQEVADVVLLLAGDRSGDTTGADVVIDGGLAPML
jgi:NAD(P)-dependent dehydrogenase (short-subunit alcohol dehydrogenase family)